MRMIHPKLDAPTITIAEDQAEYLPVTAALVTDDRYAARRGHNAIVIAFRPSDAERAKLAAGEDIYISLWTFGGPMQPIQVHAGVDEPSQIWNVPVAL
jgi:hypothetical protein